jgi:hypothetical protein
MLQHLVGTGRSVLTIDLAHQQRCDRRRFNGTLRTARHKDR